VVPAALASVRRTDASHRGQGSRYQRHPKAGHAETCAFFALAPFAIPQDVRTALRSAKSCAPYWPLSDPDSAPATRGVPHKRVLTALLQPSTPRLGHLVCPVRACSGSLLEPGSYRDFLMPPSPWPATQKAAQPWEASLKASLRPSPLYLLPQGVEAQPTEEPTADHRHLRRGGGT
jgi:hypothetical protein